jgi:hypothetical protein
VCLETPSGELAGLAAGRSFELQVYLPGLPSYEVLRLSGTVRWVCGGPATVELGGLTRPVSLVDRCRLERLLVWLIRIEAVRGAPKPAAVADLRRAVLGRGV